MIAKHLILATAGHVDHGKTALVKALTGTDTDRLPQEKARGITIELGFAHLQLGDVSLGIIDVPGHQDFVKNMVAGVGAIDLALLVVAADDGWMPQTEEHLQILTYLGVTRAVIALSKIDLVSSPNAAAARVRTELVSTAFASAAIVPVVAKSGLGVEELKAQLARECASLSPPRDIEKPRLAVDRAFNLHGVGMVATGTLVGGKLHRGDPVVVQPCGRSGRVRTIQSHGREIDVGEPAMRTALNLPGLEVTRGQVVTRGDLGKPTTVIDVLVTRSARLASNTRPLKHGSVVRVHHGTDTSSARIFFASKQPLAAGETSIAELRFESPIFAFAGDRFVFRDCSEEKTIAGAFVLDPNANPREFHSAAQQRLLGARAASPNDPAVFVQTQLQHDHVAQQSALLLKSHFSAAEIQAATAGEKIAGEFVCDRAWWEAIRRDAAALIASAHAAHPNHVGLELARLRDSLPSDLSNAGLFDALLADLCAIGFVRSNDTIRRADHRPTLSPLLEPSGSRIRTALAANPFDPPSKKELAPDAIAREALRFLRDTNEIVEISSDVVVSRDALQQMRERIAQALRANGGATVSELRKLLGSSRRVVVPLLEYFDRLGLTRRIGDKRVLGSAH